MTELFWKALRDNPEFQETAEIIRHNVRRGGVWLIGGFVFRSIAHMLYGSEKPKVDLDFLVEDPTEKIIFPSLWEERRNRYGNPKFVRSDGLEVDFIPWQTLPQRRQGSLSNFLSGTPLNVQSITYNVLRHYVEGPIGIQALCDKIVAVNDPAEAVEYARRKAKPLNLIITEKALSLGFTPVLVT